MKILALGLGLIVSLHVGAQEIDDPWSLVPALPSACYGDQDDFSELVDENLNTAAAAVDTQTALNDEASAYVSSAAEEDPFAVAQRMQDYLMQNPEDAMKMMEGLYATGQTATDEIIGQGEREGELIAVLDGLIARYQDDFAAMRAPTIARVAALPTKVVGEGFDVFTDEAIAQLPAINRQASAAYEKFCTDWWRSTRFTAAFADYRAFLTDEKIPFEVAGHAQTKQQLDIQGADTSEYRSTTPLEAARDYLKQLQRAYAIRVETPTDLHTRAE